VTRKGSALAVRELRVWVVAALLGAGTAISRAQGPTVADMGAPAASATLEVPTSVVSRVAIERAIHAKAWEQASTLLVSEIERRPHDAQMLVLVARVFFLDHKPLNAAIALKKADAIRPLDPGERLLLALSYMSMSQGEWARPELERLLANDPANLTYTYWLGRLDYDKGQFESALARFKAVTGRQAANVRAWDNMGLCYEALDRVDDAATAYDTAVATNRKTSSPSPWPPLNFGALLRRAGRLDRAEALLREAVQYDEGLARAHYELGVVLEEKGDLSGAVASLNRAASADAAYAEPHYALARIYRRQGDGTAADAALATFARLKERHTSTNP